MVCGMSLEVKQRTGSEVIKELSRRTQCEKRKDSFEQKQGWYISAFRWQKYREDMGGLRIKIEQKQTALKMLLGS